jgi:hypothetical protein
MTTSQPDQQFSAGTVDDGAQDSPLYGAEGKKSGHGAIAWLPAPDYAMPAPQPWPTGPGPHPVIALLDGVVEAHNWLPDGGDPPFVVDATQHGWSGPDLDDEVPPAAESGLPDFGSHSIHATFIAGIIRLKAPDARILSVPVMNSQGKAKQSDVVRALKYLADPPPDVSVDIVLMAFGRQADPDDDDLDDLKTAVHGLGGVPLVTSCGNDGSDRTIYPAALAAERGLSVVSVGALATPTERAPYSNYGPWVREWRKGTNIISISPLTTNEVGEERATVRSGSGSYTVAATGNGYAWWSGTSFAAARYAAGLANQMSED